MSFFPEVMLLKSDTIADSGTLPLSAPVRIASIGLGQIFYEQFLMIRDEVVYKMYESQIYDYL